jgi:hypothetical protein
MDKSFYRLALPMGAALVAGACADTGGAISQKEDMLLSAGFVSKKIDAAAQMANLKSLPPHQFVARNRNGRTRYLYADPTVCGCIYVGDQNAYDQYRQQMAARGTGDGRPDTRHFEHRTAAWRRGAPVETRQRRQATSRRGTVSV